MHPCHQRTHRKSHLTNDRARGSKAPSPALSTPSPANAPTDHGAGPVNGGPCADGPHPANDMGRLRGNLASSSTGSRPNRAMRTTDDTRNFTTAQPTTELASTTARAAAKAILW